MISDVGAWCSCHDGDSALYFTLLLSPKCYLICGWGSLHAGIDPWLLLYPKKIAESMSSSLLMCTLKYPSNRLSGYFGRRSVTKLVKSSRKALLVDLFLSEVAWVVYGHKVHFVTSNCYFPGWHIQMRDKTHIEFVLHRNNS